ncbi:MAG: TIR domain-containing protein [Oscillospiraceae bacterium]|nr:TIR domain-containing protein [Oscillospiraceae bacterium]
MAIIKCKMCGGDLELVPDTTVCECEYCGTRQTVPAADDEKKLKLFERANRLRRACEFDKAAGVYESIVADFDTEAEAYWGLVLCKFGIEYVDDPATGKKVPTCHRAGFESVEDDPNYEQACENADATARRVYRAEGRAIDELRERILEVSGKEEPYDIFISYKELTEDGERTEDSVLAQDIYDALTARGYRVFFSRITLEDKLGVEYEPYIFAALQSAKVMLLVGMDFENLNAVWVKNEWSRYLALMAKDKEKVLIPCYKDMDPYDLPKEVRKLAAQDMGKVGAMQDLLRGVEKILPLKKPESVSAPQPVVVQQSGPNVTAMLDRGALALENGEWKQAQEHFDKALNMDGKCAEAYLGLTRAELNMRSEAEFETLRGGSDAVVKRANYKNFLRFASPERASEIQTKVETAERQMQERLAALAKAEKKAQAAARAEAQAKVRAFREKVDPHREDFPMMLDWIYATEKDIIVLSPPNNKANGTGEDPHAIWDELKKYEGGWKLDRKKKEWLLKSDGTVCYFGSNSEVDVSGWNGIVSVVRGPYRDTLTGLKASGRLLMTGSSLINASAVERETNIRELITGYPHVYGLRRDGTVAVFGAREELSTPISGWQNIKTLCPAENHTVGLRLDGTVVAAGSNEYGQCDVAEWRDVVEIAVNRECTYGLRKDGTVLAVGRNEYNMCDVSDWKDVVRIRAFRRNVFGICKNGTVLSCGHNTDFYGWTDSVPKWRNVVDVVGAPDWDDYYAGLRTDGKVYLYVHFYSSGTGLLQDWSGVIQLLAVGKHLIGIKEDGSVLVEADKVRKYSRFNRRLERDKKDKIIEIKTPKPDAEIQKDLGYDHLSTRSLKLFSGFDQLCEELQAEKTRIQTFRDQIRQECLQQIETCSQQQAAAQEELSELKGLFSGRRRRELEDRIQTLTSQMERARAEITSMDEDKG